MKFLAMVFLLVSLVSTEDCQPGLRKSFDSKDAGVVTTASASSSTGSRGSVLALTGSFIALESRDYSFKLITYGISDTIPGWTPHFSWDGQADRLNNPVTSGYSVTYTLQSHPCVEGFRYRIEASGRKFFNETEVNISIQLDGSVLSGEYIETCNISGCLNESYSRSPYNCKPAPTQTQSPSPTQTQSPTPTRTQTPSPSASPVPTISKTDSWSQTKSPSPTATKTSSPTISQSPTLSSLFLSSVKFSLTFSFFQSNFFAQTTVYLSTKVYGRPSYYLPSDNLSSDEAFSRSDSFFAITLSGPGFPAEKSGLSKSAIVALSIAGIVLLVIVLLVILRFGYPSAFRCQHGRDTGSSVMMIPLEEEFVDFGSTQGL